MEPFFAAHFDAGPGSGHRGQCQNAAIAFKRHFGCSPWTYLKLCRLENVRAMLADRNNTMNVTEIAITCGFNHLSDFNTAHRKRFGETPRKSLLYTGRFPNEGPARPNCKGPSERHSLRRFQLNIISPLKR